MQPGIRTARGRRPFFSLRNAVQASLALYLLFLGWRFYSFVRFYESGGATTFVPRPAGVEGFLPISALLGLRYFLATGLFDTVHPAALAILLAVLLVSLIYKKGFCSWLCPVGGASEGLGLLGKSVLGRNYGLPRCLDLTLMSLKYLLLAFFLGVVFFSMSPGAVKAFLSTPYNAVADVKMLQFFLAPSPLALGILLSLALLSIFFQHFWCRYLCPYGALLGIVSFLSPFKVERNREECNNCRRCDRACPSGLHVSRAGRVFSPECTGCLQCLEKCPRPGALGVGFRGLRLQPLFFGVLLLLTFFLVLAAARWSGHWQTSLTAEDYRLLIPQARSFTHP